MKIVVRIDRLVLDGMAHEPGHPARVRVALESELARLMAGPHVPRLTGGAAPYLRAPDFRLAHGETPEATGRRIARAVHQSLGGRPVGTRGGWR